MSRLSRAIIAAAGLAILVVAGATLVGGDDVVEAARDGRPNVVVIMTDDQYNTTIHTMDYVDSRDDWARFSNAMVNTALCCPSRSTFLTGQTSSHTGIESNSETRLFKDRSTVANWLEDAGYQTGYVGKYLNKFPWGEADNYIPDGWDYWSGYTGRQTYFNFALNENGTVVDYNGARNYSTDVLTDRAVDFLDQVNPNKPFFTFISYNSPHSPSTPAPRHADADVEEIPEGRAFLEKNVSDKPEWIRKSQTPGIRKLREKRIRHQQALLSVDEGVERIFNTLEDRGLLDNTVVIYTTDHGISIGEHNYDHKTCGYEVCSRVPLLVRGPGVVPGRVRGLVGNIDYAPTITDYAGIRTGEKVDGRSIRPLLERRKKSLHKAILLVRAQGQADRIFMGIRTPKWKYIHYKRTDELELYNLNKDPEELVNLMSTGRKKWDRKAAKLERRMITMKKTRPKIRKP